MVKKNTSMKNYNCPICNKPGLEDYSKKKIECPGCGSDLGVFVNLKQTTFIGDKLKIAIFTTFAFASILSILLILSLINSNENLNSSIVRSDELSDSLTIMKKTIIQLNDSIKSIQQAEVTNQDSITNYYVVKRGDSFCRISYKLFGSEQYAKDIAELNGKDLSALIFPDTKLLIPQK